MGFAGGREGKVLRAQRKALRGGAGTAARRRGRGCGGGRNRGLGRRTNRRLAGGIGGRLRRGLNRGCHAGGGGGVPAAQIHQWLDHGDDDIDGGPDQSDGKQGGNHPERSPAAAVAAASGVEALAAPASAAVGGFITKGTALVGHGIILSAVWAPADFVPNPGSGFAGHGGSSRLFQLPSYFTCCDRNRQRLG
ncbi:hypothetical protein SDC9_65034 [bioreactor metagenome]|uniref:Uncharacterized protein n=1 Tax=bioreactor metagenome TaxID=1076179 RepID=A0A644XS85_9ZZZZ